MSRPIKMTQNMLDECRAAFEELLSRVKLEDGKITFEKRYTYKDDDKATIIFSQEAYYKMTALIHEFSDEVAWHGVCTRDAEDESVFYIKDIIVYPQEVTGATVNTDQVEYQNWLMGLDDDTFNNLRMQGHSHVNMNTSPSGVDTTHQGAILQQLNDDMFYVFMIWNKSLDHYAKIYDLKNNTLYENKDIDIKIEGFEEFVTKAKELVKKKVYSNIGYSRPASTGCNYPTSANQTSKKKEETKKETKSSVYGNGWKGRGLSDLDDYYADIYDDYETLPGYVYSY